MSLYAMTVVWKYASKVFGNDLVVLLALADWANDDGLSWHSVPKIALKAHISERTVQRCLSDLEEIKYLRVERGGPVQGTSRYYVLLQELLGGDNLTPGVGEVVTLLTPGVVTNQVGGGDNVVTRYQIDTKDNTKELETKTQAQAHVPAREEEKTISLTQMFEPAGLKLSTALGSTVPDSLIVTDAGFSWATKNGWRGTREGLQTSMDSCVDYWLTNAGRCLDWQARARTWVRNQIAWGKDLQVNGGNARAVQGGNGNGVPQRRTGQGWDRNGNPTNKQTQLLSAVEQLAEGQRARRLARQTRDNTVTLGDDEWRGS